MLHINCFQNLSKLSFQLFKMESTSTSYAFNKILLPPKEVKGMVNFDKDKFRKVVEFPYVQIPSKLINRVIHLKSIQQFMLAKLPRIKAFRDSEFSGIKMLLLDPDKFSETNSLQKVELIEQICNQIGARKPLEIGKHIQEMEYEDWDQKRCIRAVLPDEFDFSGFEQCGHIIHLNLREELLPYRFVLGQILVDKISNIRTVVNKLEKLSTEFRTMDMELLAGEADYKTQVMEHGICYKLDYSQVFWNSRLGTVHAETVEKFDKNSVIFDVFAGIGPFILPAVKKQRIRKAYGNDLNPSAIDYMRQSIRANRIPEDRIETFVMDGVEFIRQIIPANIAQFCEEKNNLPSNFHVVMNLPGHSADYLPHFRGFLFKFPQIKHLFDKLPIWVHCHFFVKADGDYQLEWYEEEARKIIHDKMSNSDLKIQELIFNRKVAARKNMFCARIQLPVEYSFEVTGQNGKSAEERKKKGNDVLEEKNGEAEIVIKKQKII